MKKPLKKKAAIIIGGIARYKQNSMNSLVKFLESLEKDFTVEIFIWWWNTGECVRYTSRKHTILPSVILSCLKRWKTKVVFGNELKFSYDSFVNRTLSQFYSLEKSFNLLSLNIKDRHSTPDVVIKVRTDFLFNSMPKIKLSSDTFTSKYFHNVTKEQCDSLLYCCDQFFYGSYDTMEKVCKFYSKWLIKYHLAGGDITICYPQEKLFADYLKIISSGMPLRLEPDFGRVEL